MSELIIFRCKKCSNELPINTGARVTLFCQHCGNKELIPDEDIVLKCIFCEQEFCVKKNEPNKNRNKCHQSRQAGGNSLLFEVKAKSQEPATLKPKVIDGDSSNKDKSVLNRIIDKFNKKLNNIPASDNKTKILDLEYDDIKKALGQRNDGFLISVVEGYLSGFKKFNTELIKEACKKLNLNYRLITFETEKLKTKDLAIINISDLVICQPNIYIENIIKLRVSTIIIHTPCDKEYKNELSYYGVLKNVSPATLSTKIKTVLKIPNLSYCICTHNNIEITQKCIDLIRKAKKFNEEIVVFDNNSTDGTVKWIKEQKDIVAEFSEENIGCIKARNQLAKIAKGRNILFLDNDQFIAVNTTYLLRSVDADIVGNEGWNMNSNGEPSKVLEKASKPHYVGAGGMMISKSLFLELGGFDEEKYSPAWYEDPDFCFSAKEKGYKIVHKDANIEHIGNKTSSTQKDFNTGGVKKRSARQFRTKWDGKFNIQKNSLDKPHICIIADVRGWAWDHKAQNIKTCLNNDFDITIKYIAKPDEKIKDDNFDLYLTFDPPFVRLLDNISFNKRITGVTAHTYVNFPHYKELLNQAPIVHANSMHLYNELKKINDNCFYVPNGVDEKLFHFMEKDIDDEFRVGYVGKNTKRKGLDEYIIPACEKAKVKLKKQVAKHGWPEKIDNNEMPNWYKDIDVIMIASDMDGTPNQLLEAAAIGRTFIGNNIGNIPQFVVQYTNGILVERDIDLYVEMLNIFKKDRKMCQLMGVEARQTIEENWTWKKQAENYKNMFNKALEL